MNISTPTQSSQEKAVLFADVCDSTQLYVALGDVRAFATINRCLDILRRLTSSHSGQVIKTIGDEIMAVFPDTTSAVQAACEMQLVINAQTPIDDKCVAIRIGLHSGPVLENSSDGDVFGDTVNIAARMAEIAKARQIITTGTTVAKLPPIMRTSTRTFNALSIKGKTADIEVREIIWQESDEMTMMVGNTFFPDTAEPTLQLIHQGDKFIVDGKHSTITIGRDEQADIVVQDRSASRMHARILHRRGKFVFVDISTNGSYILIKGEAEIQLRREEFVLRGCGSISLGHSYKKDSGEIIEFFCE